MKAVVFILAAAMLAAPVQAVQLTGNTVTLTEAEVKRCQAGGGCDIYTKADIEATLNAAIEIAVNEGYKAGAERGYRAGHAKGLETCKGKT